VFQFHPINAIIFAWVLYQFISARHLATSQEIAKNKKDSKGMRRVVVEKGTCEVP
jgi:hypothetical protein